MVNLRQTTIWGIVFFCNHLKQIFVCEWFAPTNVKEQVDKEMHPDDLKNQKNYTSTHCNPFRNVRPGISNLPCGSLRKSIPVFPTCFVQMLFWSYFRLSDLVVCGYDVSMATSSTAHGTGSTTNVWIPLSVFWVFIVFCQGSPEYSPINYVIQILRSHGASGILPGGFKGFYPWGKWFSFISTNNQKAGRLNHQTIVQNVLLYKVVPLLQKGWNNSTYRGFSGHL